jgi:hypothetical protein
VPRTRSCSASCRRSGRAYSSRCCPSCELEHPGSHEQVRGPTPAAEPRRGRRKHVLAASQRSQIALLVRQHPGWGLTRIRQRIPGLPKNAAATYLKRLKRIMRRRSRRHWCRLTWRVPGAVWALDGTWMDRVVDDIGRRALLVAEMHRRKPLALQSVRGERTGDTISLLQRLIDVHGPPLVLKVDNGSAFIAKRLADFCDGHGMVLMHSPIRQPRWNGTCEVLGRWTKKRAAAAACHWRRPTSMPPSASSSRCHQCRPNFVLASPSTSDASWRTSPASRGLPATPSCQIIYVAR